MNGNQPRVLVVDDEPSILATVSRRLQSAGYGVTATSDVEEALVSATASAPDLILLDRRLGQADGLELLAALKAGHGTKDIPVVVVSGCPSDEADALSAGAAGFLEKPFGSQRLLETAKAIIVD